MSLDDARHRAVEWVMNARNGDCTLAVPAGDDPVAFAGEVQHVEDMLGLLDQLPTAPVPLGLADRTLRRIHGASGVAASGDAVTLATPEH